MIPYKCRSRKSCSSFSSLRCVRHVCHGATRQGTTERKSQELGEAAAKDAVAADFTMEVSINGGTPIAGWFLWEAPVWMMIWGYPHLWKTSPWIETPETVVKRFGDLIWQQLTWDPLNVFVH